MVPPYTAEELEWGKGRELERDLSGWLTKDNKLLTPGAEQWKILKHFHESSQLRQDYLVKLVTKVFLGKGLSQIVKNVTKACELCAPSGPGRHPILPPPNLAHTTLGNLSRGGMASGLDPNAPM